jgi:hypothetical protein
MKNIFNNKRTKDIARLMLLVWLINLLQPAVVYALTSGPGQPESQSFQPAGVSDMVDLVSGDFKYNIPLMDVDGYPLNLNYQSGVGMDDEASWVGLGWNLNVGSINRQLRGIPDDFAGDTIKTQHHTKDKVTVGGKLTAKVELFGANTASKLKLGGSFSFGVFSDNYTGIGAELGVNAGISFSLVNNGLLTGGLGIGILSSTAGGVDITPNASLSIAENSKMKGLTNAGLSASLGYNSRSGMKTLNFGSTFKYFDTSFPGISFNTEPIMPKIQIPYNSTYDSFSIDVGGVAAGLFGGFGGTGYKNVRKVATEQLNNPGYGFLYADLGKNKANAVMDFIREKENPIIPELPNLALPVHTPDIFTYNSQSGSGQFRLFRGGTGIFFDNESTDKSTVSTMGSDIGLGFYAHAGVTKFNQTTYNTTRKWTRENDYVKNGDFQDAPTTDPRKQHVFFKSTDEKNMEDTTVSNKLLKNALLSVLISGKKANSSFISSTNLSTNLNLFNIPIVKQKRELQKTQISYLTSNETADAGLDRTIDSYHFNNFGDFQPPANDSLLRIERENRKNQPLKKKHHISEITVNAEDGKRMVYGLPVYNLKQDEYSFALDRNYNSKDGLVEISKNGIERDKGLDHYYHVDSQAPYAYSYLLTGVLSPDYVDKTGNGITDDDNGTAIKFNYSKIDRYKWRTPYNNAFANDPGIIKNLATLNRGLLADPEDDKASIVYGEKEIYYVQSIESKTKVAYFITEDREDGLGVKNLNGEMDTNVRLKRLREIRLYSKADLTKPIKIVKFDYGYELCPGTPNSTASGKLTLKKVWFEYGLTHKGSNHPYVFNYNNTINGTPVKYGSLQTDRWGTYKAPGSNPNLLSNEEYPYSNQIKLQADSAAKLWHVQSVELPSGGKIKIDYEADDYAYVQDKRAMQMVPFEMLGSDPSSLINSPGIKISISELPPQGSDVTSWFKNTYLNGSDYVYTKANLKISTSNAPSFGRDQDFVPSYCKISNVTINSGKAEIRFEIINESNVKLNPIRFAALQRLKNEYPRYAYPGFQNKVSDKPAGVESVVNAIINAAGNLSELKENFYEKANRKGYAGNVDLTKSFVKIVKQSGSKIGGGVRVRKISISDDWQNFTSNNANTAIYGQSYEYTTSVNGKKISSGVAANEPSVGNDESPLKQPVPYIQKIKGAINNYFELEEPFGESFYPAPGIAYSKITVRDLEAGETEVDHPTTGHIVNEFYTAKDFPVQVKVSAIQRYNPKPSSYYSLIRTQSIEEMVLSQGYSIELNDMHGKPKATRIFNQSGSEISSTEYRYKVENPNAERLTLKNMVNVINRDGTTSSKIIGRDIEFFTDFREQETNNTGLAVNIGFVIIPAFFIPIPIPHWPVNGNDEYKLFRSSCAVKVIQTTGIIDEVIKSENGSSISVQNVAFDGITGDALVTKTQNEFKKDYYSVNLPAYWIYDKMGGAYQNLGMILKDVKLNNFYEVNEAYWSLLTQGDELVNLNTGEHFWVVDNRNEMVVENPPNNDHFGVYLHEATKILINRAGKRLEQINLPNNSFKVVRSGYRNQLNASAASLVSVDNPLKNGVLALSLNQDIASLKVINASATTFDEEWPVDGSGQRSESVKNNSSIFTFQKSISNTLHGNAGCRFYNFCSEGTEVYCGEPYYYFNNVYLNKRIDAVGIWPDPTIVQSLQEPLGVLTSFTAPSNKTYYLGFAGDDRIKITIDNIPLAISDEANSSSYWQIIPLDLTEGLHSIEIEGYNESITPNNPAENPAAIAVEIYNNTIAELENATGASSLNTIFQTSSLINDTNAQTFRTVNGSKVWRFNNSYYFNPFIEGMKGNWRPFQQLVYQENRAYGDIFKTGKKGINTKNAGYLKSFFPNWSINQDGYWYANLNSGNWIVSNKISLYDKFGQELENQDALNRYSAAKFDFNGQFPSAVASNAMNREIYVNAFEDLNFKPNAVDTNKTKEFTTKTGLQLKSIRTSQFAHTGNYSVALPTDGIVLLTNKHLLRQKTFPYLGRNAKQEFFMISREGLFPRGFEPQENKKYIFNAWVRDGQANNMNINISVAHKSQNQVIRTVALSCKAVIEGWKLLEGVIDLNGVIGNKLELTVSANSPGIYIDDIRIHPLEGHLKSYAYNDKNFRLMAELDENAFATFYEYDDEGSLIRVKKETERGIVTIKENRSSYKQKNNNPVQVQL